MMERWRFVRRVGPGGAGGVLPCGIRAVKRMHRSRPAAAILHRDALESLQLEKRSSFSLRHLLFELCSPKVPPVFFFFIALSG